MYKRNREKRSKLNEDRVARAAGVGSSSGGTKAATVVSASQPLVVADNLYTGLSDRNLNTWGHHRTLQV